VGGGFFCKINLLTSLDGGPETVGGNFLCGLNQLTSLEGCPRSVGGGFFCEDNRLTSLKGGPRVVGTTYDCSNNQLTSLEGGPESIGGVFYSEGNPVGSKLLNELMDDMLKNGGDFSLALKNRWDGMSLEDKTLMYRPDFKWMSDEDRKEMETLMTYNRIKDVL
jgi:hypothetical protein